MRTWRFRSSGEASVLVGVEQKPQLTVVHVEHPSRRELWRQHAVVYLRRSVAHFPQERMVEVDENVEGTLDDEEHEKEGVEHLPVERSHSEARHSQPPKHVGRFKWSSRGHQRPS